MNIKKENNDVFIKHSLADISSMYNKDKLENQSNFFDL